VYTTV